MNQAHHDSNKPILRSHPENPSLAELDVLVRRCHHLHDEEVINSLKKMWNYLKRSIGYQPISAPKIVDHDYSKA